MITFCSAIFLKFGQDCHIFVIIIFKIILNCHIISDHVTFKINILINIFEIYQLLAPFLHPLTQMSCILLKSLIVNAFNLLIEGLLPLFQVIPLLPDDPEPIFQSQMEMHIFFSSHLGEMEEGADITFHRRKVYYGA